MLMELILSFLHMCMCQIQGFAQYTNRYFPQVCTNKKYCHCEGGFDPDSGCAFGKRQFE